MKRIIAEKSGRWAQEGEPGKKQVVMIEGTIYNEKQVPLHMMEMLVGKKFAKYTTEEDEASSGTGSQSGAESGSTDESKSIRKVIDELLSAETNKNKKKDILEEWALDKLKIDIHKGKALDFLIEQVVTEFEKQNG